MNFGASTAERCHSPQPRVGNREPLKVTLVNSRQHYDLCSLLELFEKRGVALISVAESLDTASAAGRLVTTIMAAVSQWERELNGDRTRDSLRHKRTRGERAGKYPVWIPS